MPWAIAAFDSLFISAPCTVAYGLHDTGRTFIYSAARSAFSRHAAKNIFPAAGEVLPASSPLLVNDELVWTPEEDLGWPVLTEFAAQGTLDGDGLEWELLAAGGHVAAAPFALHDECFPASRGWEHDDRIGEYRANIQGGCLGRNLPKDLPKTDTSCT